MNVLLFGGSFNPPHLGHLLLIEQAFELIPNLDELWLIPCYNHVFDKTLAPAADRLRMCQFLIENLEQVKVCPVEIDNQTNGSTYKTLHLLPQNHYSFLIGSDQLPYFKKWQHWQELLTEMPFFVYPRCGYPLKPLYPGMTALEAPTQVITNLSSTLVRRRLSTHQSVSRLLPDPVNRYITGHHLYGI